MSDAHAQAFGALHRLLLVVDPDFGEGYWQLAHAFRSLPHQHQTPGHWYRGQGLGFIHVDENLNGEFVKQLPAGVDPAEVVDIPPANHMTVVETMGSLLPNIDGPRRAHFQSQFDALEKTASVGHPSKHVLNYQQIAYAALLTSPDYLVQYVEKSAAYHEGTGLIEGSVTGRETAAALLICGLAKAVAPTGPRAVRVFEMLVTPGAQDMEALAERMVHDCIVNGFSQQVGEVLASVLRQANGLADGAREGLFPVGHSEMMLGLYYFGLFAAAPYLRAAMIGYGVARRNPDLSEREQRLHATRSNAAEEKLARVADAMMFAVRDLDGSERQQKRAKIQALLAAGEREKAEGLALEAVDLKLFFPKPYRRVLLET